MLAAVRSATPGTDPGIGGGRAVHVTAAGCSATTARWTAGRTAAAGARRDAARRRRCSGWRPGSTRRCCGRWSWHRLAPGRGAGRRPGRHRRGAVRAAGVTGRFNFLLTDGQVIAATAAGRHAVVPACARRRRGRLGTRRRRARLDRGARRLRADRDAAAGQRALRWPTPADDDSASPEPETPRTEGSRSDDIPRPPATARLPRGSTARRRAGPGSRRNRSRCRPSGSTTRRAARCSTRSPNCPSTTRPAPSGRSCARTRPEIAAQTSARTLIELGSGSSDKTRLLLDALRDAGTLRCYVPVDVSEPALAAAGKALSAEYPGLDVRAVVSDFEERLGFPADGPGTKGRRAPAGRLPRQHDREPGARAAGRLPGPGQGPAAAG